MVSKVNDNGTQICNQLLTILYRDIQTTFIFLLLARTTKNKKVV